MCMVSSACEVHLLTECNYAEKRTDISHAKSDKDDYTVLLLRFLRLSQQKRILGSISNVPQWRRREAVTSMPKFCDLIILRSKNKQPTLLQNLISFTLLRFLLVYLFFPFVSMWDLFWKQYYLGSNKKGRFLWLAGEAWWGWQAQSWSRARWPGKGITSGGRRTVCRSRACQERHVIPPSEHLQHKEHLAGRSPRPKGRW